MLLKLQYRGLLFIFILLLCGTLSGCQSTSSPPSHKNTSKKTSKVSTAQAKSKTKSKIHPWSTIEIKNIKKPFAQPVIYKNSMVWVGDKSDNGSIQNPNAVFMMDLTSQKKKVIASTSYKDQPVIKDPNISKNWITWLDYGVVNNLPQYTIFAFNRKTHKQTPIVKFPGNDGNHHVIVWSQLENSHVFWFEPLGHNQYRFKEYNLDTKKSKTITTVNSILAPDPTISNDMVVWEDSHSNWQGTIHALNLKTGKDQTFSVDGPAAFPKISGSYIVYSPQKTKNSQRVEIDYKNLDTNHNISLTAITPYFWDIGQGYVTWCDYSQGDSTIKVQTLGENSKLFNLGKGALPYAYGEKIVWQSDDGNHVYLTKLKIK